MREYLKKLLVFIFVFTLVFSPVTAKERFKAYGNINHDFSFSKHSDMVKLKLNEENTLPDGTVIPAGAVISCEIMQVQRERRWHKSGYILSKLDSYTVDNDGTSVDLSDKNVYLAVRKYEAIDGKEAAILTSEIIVTQAAGIVGSCFIFFAPVDIVYFFTKGAIKREKHHNWFKAGVHDAYDNSICWFWLKGKPIELQGEESIKIQSISEKKAMRLDKQIAKRNEKQAIKDEKKQAKIAKKEEKKQAKLDKLKEKNPEKYAKKIKKMEIKQQKRDAKIAHEKAVQQEIFDRRNQKAQLRKKRKEAKKQLKQEKKEQKLTI